MPARSFGKYEVLARLATGGAANIFLARQPGAAGFQKLVCLKTLLPERASDADFVAMFLDEARLAARLNHPNCVQIYDLGQVRGVYYISMEYIFGETLWNLLTTVTKLKTPLPATHVAAIVASACDGLHHAHELKDQNGRPYNLVHRDVSPQNVMITFEGQTKVVDFGIAKAETGRAPTIAGIVKGKFSYMSPEQITGGQVDRRSDIFSLGIVLFECLASRRLYRGDSPEEIARLILEHRAPRLRDVVPDIPAELEEVCARALGRHPSKRFQDAQEMGEALRTYLDDVRYNQSASSLSRLLTERFGNTIVERRKVYEGALLGSYDEAHLLKGLDARAVRDVDLFPENEGTSPLENPSETKKLKSEGRPGSRYGGSVTQPPPLLGEEQDSSSAKRRGAGFRVELESSVDPRSLHDSDTGPLLPESATDGGATRIDPEEEPVESTQAEPEPTPAGGESESRTEFDPERTDSRLEPGPPESEPEGRKRGRDRQAPAARGGSTSTRSSHPEVTDVELDPDERWEDKTKETDFFEAPALDETLDPDLGRVESSPVVAAVLAEVTGEAPSDPADAGPRGRAAAVPGMDDTADDFRPEGGLPAALAAIEAAPRPPASVSGVTRPSSMVGASRSAPSAPETPVVTVQNRFSLAAVLAALGFGISLGIVIGMILARVVFGSSEPTRIETAPSARQAPP